MAAISVRTLKRRFDEVSQRVERLQNGKRLRRGKLDVMQACGFVAAVELLRSAGTGILSGILQGGTSSNTYSGSREKEWRLYSYSQDYVGPRSVVLFEYGVYRVQRLVQKSKGWSPDFDARLSVLVPNDDEHLHIGVHLSPVAEYVRAESLEVRTLEGEYEIGFSVVVGSGEIKAKALAAARDLARHKRAFVS
jgi:hypothetical protein